MLNNLIGSLVLVMVFAWHARSRWPRIVRACLFVVLLALMAAIAPLDVNNPQPLAHASTTAGAVFLRKIPSAILNDQTNSMSVGVDAAGGLHAAFANFSTDTGGNYHAYYDYCAPGLDCANAANWTLVTLLTVASSTTIMDATQLALDPQGPALKNE